MKLLFLAACVLATSAASAQALVSTSPVANALAVPRTATVSVQLGGTPTAGAALRVFSNLAGGRKVGTTTATATGLTFTPSTAFKAGETLWATYTDGAGHSRVWQFTAAAGGNGVFGGGSNFSHPAYPYGTTLLNLTVGDLTSDGSLDIVGAEIGTNGCPAFTTYGTGQISRLSIAVFAFGYTIKPFAPFGDVDGDGLLDIIDRHNTGPGQFTAISGSSAFPAGYNFGGAQADLDGDGDLDYAYAGYNSQNVSNLHVATNNGSGSYSFSAPSVVLAQEGLLSAGDLDGDGDIDLINLSASQTRPLELLLNDGHGVFSVGPSYAVPFYLIGAQVQRVVLGDVDGDGDLDILASTAYGTTVLLNNSTGLFTNNPNSGLGSCSSLSLGDVDGDGDLDAVASGKVFLNNGTGTFTPGYFITGMSADGGALLADMNNDGALDIVAAQSGNTPGNPGTGQPGILAVRLNNYQPLAVSQPAISAREPAWPNPVAAGSPLQVAVPNGTLANAALYTLAGALVRRSTLAGPTGQLATTGLAPGLYLLAVQAAGQAPLTYRVAVE